jgi:hypothetical protein
MNIYTASDISMIFLRFSLRNFVAFRVKLDGEQNEVIKGTYGCRSRRMLSFVEDTAELVSLSAFIALVALLAMVLGRAEISVESLPAYLMGEGLGG